MHNDVQIPMSEFEKKAAENVWQTVTMPRIRDDGDSVYTHTTDEYEAYPLVRITYVDEPGTLLQLCVLGPQNRLFNVQPTDTTHWEIMGFDPDIALDAECLAILIAEGVFESEKEDRKYDIVRYEMLDLVECPVDVFFETVDTNEKNLPNFQHELEVDRLEELYSKNVSPLLDEYVEDLLRNGSNEKTEEIMAVIWARLERTPYDNTRKGELTQVLLLIGDCCETMARTRKITDILLGGIGRLGAQAALVVVNLVYG